jgi:hypothetical protein
MLAPPATDARFTNDATNNLTASYHLILGDGPMGSVQVRDVFQCTARVGSFTQTYNRRAGNWTPGNFLVPRVGYELQSVPNYCGSQGTAEGLSTLSFTNTYPNGSSDWNRQINIFCRSGRSVTRLADDTVGPSSNFADLFKLAMEIGAKLPADMIDIPRLQTAALFLDANQFYCDVEITESQNLNDFVAQLAPFFLLRETRINGKRGLRPLLPIDEAYAIRTTPVPWKFKFNEDFIVPGSLQIDYTPLEERKPALMVAMWRQQPDDTFGIVQSAEVGYSFDQTSGNREQYDMSAFCTHELHAVRAMAYRRSRRRWSTHTAAWVCRPEVYSRILEEGDIVRMTFTRAASDGSVTTHDYLYQLDQITKSSTGEIEFIATHFPIDKEGRSIIALDVLAAQNVAAQHTYTELRTGPDLDDDSAGDRATNTTVPAEVFIQVEAGDPPAPPPAPPSMPSSPLPPYTPPDPPPDPPEPPPPGGYEPPSVPPDPAPTPPDSTPADPCEPTCITRIVCGPDEPSLICNPDEISRGFITAQQPEGDETCIICEKCVQENVDCIPLDCCNQSQIDEGYQCSTYVDVQVWILSAAGNPFLWFTYRTKDGNLSLALQPDGFYHHTYTSVCGVTINGSSGITNTDTIAYTVRSPSAGFPTGCFPCT